MSPKMTGAMPAFGLISAVAFSFLSGGGAPLAVILFAMAYSIGGRVRILWVWYGEIRARRAQAARYQRRMARIRSAV
jgi:hypothetical protein